MRKLTPLRLIIGIVAIIYIIFVWVKSDVGGVLASLPKEEYWSVLLTSVAVTTLKVLGIVVVGYLIKWLIYKFIKRQ